MEWWLLFFALGYALNNILSRHCTFAVDDEPGVTFSTEDDNCRSENFTRLQVDLPPNTANITVKDMQLPRRQEDDNEDVLKLLEKCTEIQPTSYPKQSIEGSSQPFSGVTYVWKIAVMKTQGNDFFIQLPDSMTPVRLDLDPPTTTDPTTTALGGGVNALSPGAIGGVVGGVALPAADALESRAWVDTRPPATRPKATTLRGGWLWPVAATSRRPAQLTTLPPTDRYHCDDDGI